jgi:FkbM family methyltransferase
LLVLPAFLRRPALESQELVALEKLLEHARPDELLADVGAYHGAFARAAADRGVDVVCFEPDPANAAHLRKFRVVQAVVSDNAQPVTFAARGSQVSGAADLYLSDETEYVVTPAVTLDAVFLDSERRVGLIKVDVEGYEGKVLRGSERVLGEARAVLVELHQAMRLVGDTPDTIRATLADFDIEVLDGDAETERAHWLAVRRGQ